MNAATHKLIVGGLTLALTAMLGAAAQAKGPAGNSASALTRAGRSNTSHARWTMTEKSTNPGMHYTHKTSDNSRSKAKYVGSEHSGSTHLDRDSHETRCEDICAIDDCCEWSIEPRTK